MMKKNLLPVLALAALTLLAIPGTSSAGSETKARCGLFHQPSVNAEGPCTVRREGNIVTVKGTLHDIKGRANWPTQEFIAVIDNGKNEGLLIGAGFFDLANGRLSSNQDNKVEWPNGYLLKIEVE